MCLKKPTHFHTYYSSAKKHSSFYVVVLKVKLSSSKAERLMLRAVQSVGSLREPVCCTLNANVTLNAVYFFSRYALRAHMTSSLVNYSPVTNDHSHMRALIVSPFIHVSFHFFQLTCSVENHAKL